jgi:hypothetical protein
VRIPDILETNLSRFKTTSTFEENQAESRKMRGREWGGFVFVIAQLSCATTPAGCSQVNLVFNKNFIYIIKISLTLDYITKIYNVLFVLKYI